TSNIFYRRSLFLSVSGFDETLSYPASHGFAVEGADTDLAWRLIERGAKKLFIEDALIYHEVQKQGVDAWLIEPWRLYIVPALIKLHPRLRQKMLVGQFFFYRNSLYYYILSILVIVLLVVSPHILLWTPVALLAIAFIKTRSISPITLFRELVKITLNTIRNYIMITALLYGSIRFRTMVL
ncbi:MAG: glycosyl transferase, partial [Gammaproteobacteria bacterium]